MFRVDRSINRRQMFFASGALVASLLPNDRAVAQGDGIQPAFDPLIGKTWVAGENGNIHTAVVRVESDSSDSPEVRCYVCDGETRSDWFTGPFVEGLQTLTAGNTTLMLDYVVDEDRMSGAWFSADGEAAIFNAYEATGLEGLYEVGPVSDYVLAGYGTHNQVIQLNVTGKLLDDSKLLSGLIALPDGSVHPLALLASPDAGGELRIIVVPGGTAAGGPRVAQGVSRGTGAVSTSIQMNVPSWTDPDPSPWISPNTEPWIDPDTQP